MTVNLQTNRSELLAAYDKVLNPNDDINWALFSYDGKTNVLKVTDTGDGGLDELSTSFNSGKVQYALASVDHVVTKQPKILLIQWQGDGVSASTLGTTATHVHEISKFFKGIHVTYHARCDDDVEPAMLMAAVNKVTAALSNVGDRSSHTSETTAPGVVSSVYKRTLPNRELNLSERDKFWQKVQEDEVSRQSDELRRLNTINEQHERDRKSHTEQLHVEQEKSMIGRQQQQQQHSPPAVFVKQQQRAPVSLPVTNRYQPPSPPSSPPPTSNGNAIHHQAPSKPVPIDDEEDGFDEHSNRIVNDEPPIVAEPEHHSIVDDNDEEHVPVGDFDDDNVQLPRAIDGLGIQAVAMWDYQAADDTELSFDPHDMITHIEQIDAGWWHGHTSDGRQGLFPANYVQLLK